MKEIGGRFSSISCDLKIQSVLTPFPKKFVYLFSNARSEQNIELKKKYTFKAIPLIQLADLLTMKNGICIRICQNRVKFTHTHCVGKMHSFLMFQQVVGPHIIKNAL